MVQVLTRAQLPADEWGHAFDRIGEDIAQRVLGARDYRSMASIVWRAVCSSAPHADAVAAITSKFFLRQFVDEIGDTAARTLLVELVYAADGRLPDDEMLEQLNVSYARLHDVLVTHERDLGILTDGHLPHAWLQTVRPEIPDSLLTYEALLFGLAENGHGQKRAVDRSNHL